VISTFTVLYTPLAARLVVRRDHEASNALIGEPRRAS
jgi:hypothetical protein